MQICGILTQKRRKPRNHPDCAAPYDLEQKKQNRQLILGFFIRSILNARAKQANPAQDGIISTSCLVKPDLLSQCTLFQK
jgi:hypothetical protein